MKDSVTRQQREPWRRFESKVDPEKQTGPAEDAARHSRVALGDGRSFDRHRRAVAEDGTAAAVDRYARERAIADVEPAIDDVDSAAGLSGLAATVRDSVIRDNGGAGIVSRGLLEVTDSIISGNDSTTAYMGDSDTSAGGVGAEGSSERVTVTGNHSGEGTGGIYNRGTMTLRDSLVALNDGTNGGVTSDPRATNGLLGESVVLLGVEPDEAHSK